MDERKLRSKKQEKRVASELKGRTQPASGALWGAKADVRSDLFLVECKTTSKSFYRLTFNVWNKIYNEALKDGMRIPVMCIDLEDGKTRLAVMRYEDLNGSFPCPYHINTAEVNSFSIKPECKHMKYGIAFTLSSKNKSYLMQAFSWDKFLEEVVDSYDVH